MVIAVESKTCSRIDVGLCWSGCADGLNGGKVSPILYRHDAWKLIWFEIFWLKGMTFTSSRGLDARYNRTCACVILGTLPTNIRR